MFRTDAGAAWLPLPRFMLALSMIASCTTADRTIQIGPRAQSAAAATRATSGLSLSSATPFVTTGGNPTVSTAVPSGSSNGSGTSPGVAAGIAVAIIAGAVLIGGLVVWFVLRQRRRKQEARDRQDEFEDPSNASQPGASSEGIRSLSEVGSLNPFSRGSRVKRKDGSLDNNHVGSGSVPTRIKTDLANQIYQGHDRNSWTPVSPVTSITANLVRKESEALREK